MGRGSAFPLCLGIWTLIDRYYPSNMWGRCDCLSRHGPCGPSKATKTARVLHRRRIFVRQSGDFNFSDTTSESRQGHSRINVCGRLSCSFCRLKSLCLQAPEMTCLYTRVVCGKG